MVHRLSLLVALGIVVLVTVVPSAAAGGGCHAPADIELSTGGDRTALIAECAFQPTVTYIEPGERITWTNEDMFAHTVTGAASSWGTEAALAKGETVTYRFDEEGVFPYYCVYHPSMVGAVVVGDATKSAGLTTGRAAVTSVDNDKGSSFDGKPATSGASQVGIVAFALAGLVGVALVRVARRR